MSFSFNVVPSALESALGKVNSVMSTAGSQIKNFFIEAAKGRVFVIAFSSDTYIKLLVDAKSTGTGIFGFSLEVLQGVIKNRSAMDFEFKGKNCYFKLTKGKYSGDFVTIPLTEDQQRMIADFSGRMKSAESSTISKDVLNKIREGLRFTGIKDVYTDKALVSHLILTEDTLTVTCLEPHHFAHYIASVESEVDFKIALPSNHFNVIDRVAEDEEGATFFVTNQNIRIEGRGFKMVLPATQSEEKNFDRVPNYLKAQKKPVLSALYEHDALAILIDNLFTLYSINSKFIVSHKAKSNALSVTFSTQNGKGADSMQMDVKVDSNVEENVDPRLLRDSVGLLKGQKKTRMEVIKQHSIVFKCQTPSKAQVTIVNSVSE